MKYLIIILLKLKKNFDLIENIKNNRNFLYYFNNIIFKYN